MIEETTQESKEVTQVICEMLNTTIIPLLFQKGLRVNF